MLVTLGLWPMFPKTPMNPQVYGKLRRDGYTIEKVVLETFPGFTLSGNLYRPAESTGKIPGLLCPHGHWEDGRVNPEVQQRCIRWAKLGCVVFMYDMVGYNDSKPFPHAFLNDRLRHWGLSLPTLQTWNSIRALDWLTSLPDVDVTRIGCTGESGGGTQTFLLTALDDRIKVSAPVVMVSDTFQGGCVCENAAGLRHGTDNVEFAAMCAPRPLYHGRRHRRLDQDDDEARLSRDPGRLLAGRLDRPRRRQVFDFPHNYNQTTRNAVYAAMGRWLLGIDEPEKTREGKQQPEKPEDLFTFDTGHPAPTNRKTPEQLEEYLIETRGSSSTTHRRPDGRPDAVGGRAPAAADEPEGPHRRRQPAARVARFARGPAHPARGFHGDPHASWAAGSTGEAIPVVRLIPAHPSGRLTVIAHPRGKAALATGAGEPSELVQALLALGPRGRRLRSRFSSASRSTRAIRCRIGPRPSISRPTTRPRPPSRCRTSPPCSPGAAPGRRARGEPGRARLGRLSGRCWPARCSKGWPGPPSSSPVCPSSASPTSGRRRSTCPAGSSSAGPGPPPPLSAPAPLWLYGNTAGLDPSWARAAYDIAGASSMLRLEDHSPAPDAIARWIDRGE